MGWFSSSSKGIKEFNGHTALVGSYVRRLWCFMFIEEDGPVRDDAICEEGGGGVLGES